MYVRQWLNKNVHFLCCCHGSIHALSIKDLMLPARIPTRAHSDNMNLLSLAALCHDEKSTVEFLQNRGILHSTRHCNNNHAMNLSFSSKIRWRCRIRGCRHEKGKRVDTWLQGSRLPLRKIILFIYCWSHGHRS